MECLWTFSKDFQCLQPLLSTAMETTPSACTTRSSIDIGPSLTDPDSSDVINVTIETEHAEREQSSTEDLKEACFLDNINIDCTEG